MAKEKQVIVFRTRRFTGDYANLPESVRPSAEKAIEIFISNPHHPSLRTRKMVGFENIWEGRISDSYRFTFTISDGIYYLRRVGPHDHAAASPALSFGLGGMVVRGTTTRMPDRGEVGTVGGRLSRAGLGGERAIRLRGIGRALTGGLVGHATLLSSRPRSIGVPEPGLWPGMSD